MTFNRESVFQLFFFGTFGWIIYQLFLLARPFLPGFFSAILLALAFYPLYARLRRRMKNGTAASLVMTGGSLLLAVLPLLIIAWALLGEADRLLPAVHELIEDVQRHDLVSLKERIPSVALPALGAIRRLLVSLNIDVKRLLLSNVADFGTLLTSWGALMARHAFFALFNGLILTIILFFAFRDGERAWRWFLNAIPMRDTYKQTLTGRVYETFRAVLVGTLATAAAQGILAMIGFWIAGVRLPILLGMATALSSLLGGSILITIPTALWTLSRSPSWGIFLLVWAFGVVGLVDNFLKPILIGSRTRMPFVLIFFSILGGVKLYGLLGFFLGPVLVASFLSLLKIFQEEYADRL